jgi:apolipoprotein N-acyltransferase
VAPRQHHLIAAFRAIENRRYLVRSTDTGLSAVVDPLGKTVAHIAPFTEGTTTAHVQLLNYRSPYSNWIGDRPWWTLLAVCIGIGIWQAFRTRTIAMWLRPAGTLWFSRIPADN